MARSATSTPAPRSARRPLNRDLILDAAIIRLIGGYEAGCSASCSPLHGLELEDDWREACRRFATAMRDIAVARPATYQLLGVQPLDTISSLRPVERLLGMLVAHGFPPATALAVYRAIVSYARGYALAEAAGCTVDAAGPAGRRRLAALPRAEFPILGGRARERAGLDAGRTYRLGLDALLAGLPDPRADD